MIQNIDSICKKEQIQMIYHLLLFLYVFFGHSHAKELGKRMADLGKKTANKKILLRFVLPYFPCFLLKRQMIFRFFDAQGDQLS